MGRWWFWAGAAAVVAVAIVIALVVHASNNSPAALRSYLHDQWSFDPDYSTIMDSAAVDYSSDVVTVRTQSDTDFTAAQHVCGWISGWLYDDGHGDAHSAIRVLARDGTTVMSQRQQVNDVCSFG